jgi:hypothetical protein
VSPNRGEDGGLTSRQAGFPWGRVLFAAAWAFVLAVAVYDAAFAWQHRANFQDWELNPFAREVARLHGLAAVFGFKALALAFAALVAAYCYRCRHWLTVPYTAFTSAVHLALSVHYLIGHFSGG